MNKLHTFLLVALLSACGGGGGGGGNELTRVSPPAPAPEPGITQADQCAALLDSITLDSPHSDWTTARAQLPASRPELVQEYRDLWRHNYRWAWMERKWCWNYVGYVPGWRSKKPVVAQRMAEMASTITGQCEGDETIGEC